MKSIEKHLQAIGCNDPQRVRLAPFLLSGEAERWWEIARRRFGNKEPTWLEFQETFNANNFPN